MNKKSAIAIFLFISAMVMQGCGQNQVYQQNIPTNEGGILFALSPAPVVTTQTEHVEVDFKQKSSAPLSSITNVSIEVSMVGMNMTDNIHLESVSPGKFTGTYQFPMQGKWIGNISYTEGGTVHSAQSSIDVKKSIAVG